MVKATYFIINYYPITVLEKIGFRDSVSSFRASQR